MRPEGWENPYNFMTGGAIPPYEKQSQAFETGADAMLEGLKKHALNYIVKGKHEQLVEDGFITWENEQSGWIVFIPEEE